MTHLLCPATGCRIEGQHQTECVAETCRGCLPRRAADGLRVCEWHMGRIAPNATEAGRLYGELALVLAGTGRGGPRVSGGAVDKSLNLNDTAATVRAEIRSKLVAWARLISDERGFTLPTDRVVDIAAYVARDPRWLAAHELAAFACDELAELVQVARPVAYPSGVRRLPVGACPECGAELLAVLRHEASLMPQEVVCTEDVGHSWTRAQWFALGEQVAGQRQAEAPKGRLKAGTLGHGGWSGRRAA